MESVKYQRIRMHSRIFLVPYEHNTLCSYIAAREPLYRQNVFQFFSNMNPVYKTQVKPGGYVPDASTEEEFEKRAITD